MFSARTAKPTLGAWLRRLDFFSPRRACAIGIGAGALVAVVLTGGAPGVTGMLLFLALLGAAARLGMSGKQVVGSERGPIAEPLADAFLDLVEIVGGRFRMGSPVKERGRGSDEGPVHEVDVSSFLCMRYPVTRRLYREIMGFDPGWPSDGSDELPVTNVSWFDAIEFCNRLSKNEKLVSCYEVQGEQVYCNFVADGYRLLTEAEWELACRAGTAGSWCCGDDEEKLGHYAWFDANSNREPRPVGRKSPNAWGLHDMHGNVWEWCWDWYGRYSAGLQRDPAGPTNGESRILRGGAFIFPPRVLRSAIRFSESPSTRFPDFGFRCGRKLIE
jgi:formylglycine-generating enzyme required for sulfatase activity